MMQVVVRCRFVDIVLAAAVVVGAVLRLLWLDDIEYKFDEAWTFDATNRFIESGEISLHGAASSQNIRHMGMSVWIYYPIGWLFGAAEPPDLALGVAVANILALLLMIVMARRLIPRDEQEVWLWAIALIALNPHCIMMSRKIWAVCLLPLFATGFLACWWRRNRAWGAFGWGLFGAVLAQIHLGAFFYSAAILLGVIVTGRGEVRWRSWLFGSAVGCCFMLPWFEYLLHRSDAPRPDAFAIHRPLHLRFWTYWISEPFSLGLEHYLKSEKADFLAGPFVGGKPTYLNASSYVLCCGIALTLMAAGLKRWLSRLKRPLGTATFSQTEVLLNSALFGYGTILTLTFLPIFRHYLLVTFPLMFVWAARLALPGSASASVLKWGRIILTLLGTVSLWLSVNLLIYIHQHGGAPGTYGYTYRSLVDQQQKHPPNPGPAHVPAHPNRHLPIPLP